MPAIPVRRPVVLQTNGNMHIQKPPVPDGANNFKANDLVQISGGALQLVPTSTDTAATRMVWGQTPDDSKAAGVKAPDAFFGENHYCITVEDAIIEMNIVDGSTNRVGDATNNNGQGGAGVTLASVAIGTLYPIKADVPGYVGVQFVDVDVTAGVRARGFLQVIGIAPNQTTADNNGRVLVKVPRANLQG